MPTLRICADLEMHYVVDDYTDPWRKPETILLLHGNNESGAAWYGWVPHLARHFLVVRPDMRGFGASTAMPRDFPWTLDVVIDDYIRLMDLLEIDRFHLVGAKSGGIIARAFAARRPHRVRTLTVAGSPPPLRSKTDQDRQGPLLKELEEHGIEACARNNTASRLSNAFPSAGAEWWIKLMSRTPLSSELGYISSINFSDITGDMPKIRCPMLVITTGGNPKASVEETRAWQEQVPNSKLVVVPGDSYHVAATDPDLCARETLEFISHYSKTH